MNHIFSRLNMSKRRNLNILATIFLSIISVIGNKADAQADFCTYTINLYDSFGDGWNGSTLTVDLDGEVNQYTIGSGDFATFEITVANGASLALTYSPGSFENEVTYEVLDSEGTVVFSDGPFPATGLVFEGLTVCSNCPKINESDISIEPSINGVDLSWISAAGEQYIIEYGPAGYPYGNGQELIATDTFISISPLNSCQNYEFYITVDCGEEDGLSNTTGPVSFMTEMDTLSVGTEECEYTLDLFDSFGDGWNGSQIIFDINGVSTPYTIASGDFASFTITATENSIVNISYVPGTFENEVSYVLTDEFGNIVLENGPFPPVGDIYSFIACPSCLGPISFDLDAAQADNATFIWDAAQDPGYYELEVGPVAFTRGFGDVYQFTDETEGTAVGLEEDSYYSAYLTYFCVDGDTIQAKSLGPIIFRTGFYNDVGVSAFLTPTQDSCDIEDGVNVTVELSNYGQNPNTLIPVTYSVNGEVPTIDFPFDGNYTGVIGFNGSDAYEFEAQYDFSIPGTYYLKGWTDLATDNNEVNDTFDVVVKSGRPLPLIEGFESLAFEEDWVSDPPFGLFAPNSHNNPTAVWGANLFSPFNPDASIITDRYGLINADDTLSFDYRYTIWPAGTSGFELQGNTLSVLISDDCGITYDTVFVIDSTNHVASADFTTIEIPLADYAGSAINIQFLAQWSVVDYWIDIDNINIIACPPTLGLTADITNASGETISDGSINVNPLFGTPPYIYEWANDPLNETSLLDGVLPGLYTVNVIDSLGCSQVKSFEVSQDVTSVEDPMLAFGNMDLSPNPTTGLLNVSIDLLERSAFNIEVYDNVGRLLYSNNLGETDSWRGTLDMSPYSSGVYFIRAYSSHAAMTKRVILNK